MGKAYETVYAFNLTIYYPYANFGAKIPNLLTAICGERLRQQPDIRLDHAKDDRPVVHVEHVPQALDAELRLLKSATKLGANAIPCWGSLIQSWEAVAKGISTKTHRALALAIEMHR